jgi:hypothetical protein
MEQPNTPVTSVTQRTALRRLAAANPAAAAVIAIRSGAALVLGCIVIVRAMTTNPCENYVSFSDHLNDRYGTYDDVTRLSSLTPGEDRKLYRLHVACNDYDATHPGAWERMDAR